MDETRLGNVAGSLSGGWSREVTMNLRQSEPSTQVKLLAPATR
jgi:hypothetical protein